MKKELSLLVLLTILWSLFFAIYKYFIWGTLGDATLTLQYISGYLSIGSILAFIIGSFLYEIIREKKFHFFAAFFSIIIMLGIMIFSFFPGIEKIVIVSLGTLLIGFFYGLWGILKNILIASEIHKNYASDTKINGIVNISFITSIVIGSISGGFIVEKFSTNGFYGIIGLLLLTVIVGIFLTKTDSQQKYHSHSEMIQNEKSKYFQDFLFIFKKYWMEMIFIGLLLVIATILSQKAIEYLVEVKNMKQSSASFLLFYSAVGSIIGNIISAKIYQSKWLYFMIFCILFGITTLSLAIFIESFTLTSIFAFFAGIFFGITFNLLESDFFKNIALDNKKSYGGASIGIIIAGVISIMMFTTDLIENSFGFFLSYTYLASILFLIGIVIFRKQNKRS